MHRLMTVVLLAGIVALGGARGAQAQSQDPFDQMADAVQNSPVVKKYLEDEKARQEAEKNKKKPKKKQQIRAKVGSVSYSSQRAMLIGVDFNRGVKALGASGNAVLAVAGQVDIGVFDGGSEKNILGGAMVFFKGNEKVTPFAQGLIGVQSCCGSSDLQLHFGGGADIDIQKNYWIRADLGFRRVFFEGGSFGELVFTGGVVIPLN